MNQPTQCSDAEPAEAGADVRPYDFFIDLSGASLDRIAVEEYIDGLTNDVGLAGTARQSTLVLPSDCAPPVHAARELHIAPRRPATAGLAFAVARAAALRRHLVVLFGALTPGGEVLSSLIEVFDRDPLFGTAQPRFIEEGTDLVWPLPGSKDRKAHDRQSFVGVLQSLPFGIITPELLAACLVIRWNVLAPKATVDEAYASSAGALLHMLCQARRLGFRNLVVNRAVVTSSLAYSALYPVPAFEDLDRLRARYPDATRAETEIAGLAQRRVETLLTVAHRPTNDRLSLLLDCRGLLPRHNGTARAALGLLDGLAAIDDAPQIDILVSPRTAAFHGLDERYPGCRRLERPAGAYAAALLTSQPLTLGTVVELHRHALVVAFNMLDTILWDTLYSAPEDLGRVWRFIARHADGLLYISEFTRERFKNRFPVSPDVRESVAHLSFLPEEQTDASARAIAVSDHILLVGNDHDHKDVNRTLELLADGFPFNRIVAVGTDKAPTSNVGSDPERQYRASGTPRADSKREGDRLSFLLRRLRTAGSRGARLWPPCAR